MLTAAQLALRQHGITGSEIAALVGLCPWRGPTHVWQGKIDPAPSAEPNKHMLKGIFLESGIIRWFEYLTKRRVTFPGTLRHPKHPIVIATPDGISHDEGGEDPKVLEVKCTTYRTAMHWGEEGTDEIPEYHWPQLQWELAVTGLQHAHVAAFFGDEVKIYNVSFNVEMFEALREIAERFWRDYVVTKTPPPVDASVSAREWLLDRFPAPTKAMKPCDSDAIDWVRQLREARTAKEEAERLESEAKNRLMEIIGEYEGIEGNWGRITWRKNKDSTAVNYKALVEHLQPDPELINKFMVTKKGPRVFCPRFTPGGEGAT